MDSSSDKSSKLYILIQSLANGLVQPFMGFLAVVTGVSGASLGVVTSAGNFFPSIVQLTLRDIDRPIRLLKYSTSVLAALWLIMAFVSYGNPILYTVNYIAIAAAGGASSYGWALLMERLSRRSRGRVLAEYGFFGSIGSLIATLTTGLIVGNNYWLVRYVFMTAAMLILGNLAILSRLRDFVYDGGNGSFRQGVKGVEKFLLITFMFAIVWSFAWPIFPMAQYYIFRMNTEQVAILSIIGGAFTMILQRPVGALVDKHRRIMLFLGRFLLITFPLMYVFSTSVYELYLFNIVSGFTNSVSATAYMAYLFDNSRDKKSAIAIYNAANGIGSLTGSVLGGVALSILEPIVGVDSAIKMLLSIDAAARGAAAVAFLALPDRGSISGKVIMAQSKIY